MANFSVQSQMEVRRFVLTVHLNGKKRLSLSPTFQKLTQQPPPWSKELLQMFQKESGDLV